MYLLLTIRVPATKVALSISQCETVDLCATVRGGGGAIFYADRAFLESLVFLKHDWVFL